MNEQSNAYIAAAMDDVKALFANDFSGHDYAHTLRVYNLATRIARAEGADLSTVQLAALLHDADDRKLSPATYPNKDNAVRFLRGQGLSADVIAAICEIIGEVSFAGADSLVPRTLEGKCVQDADRLDAIGAIGIARTFAYGGSKGRPMYDPAQKPRLGMSAAEYAASNSTSINHFYEKLLLLKDMLNTPAARAIAERRDAFMRDFLAAFLAEWNGEG